MMTKQKAIGQNPHREFRHQQHAEDQEHPKEEAAHQYRTSHDWMGLEYVSLWLKSDERKTEKFKRLCRILSVKCHRKKYSKSNDDSNKNNDSKINAGFFTDC